MTPRKSVAEEVANERAFNEGWQEHISDLLDAMKPFVSVMKEGHQLDGSRLSGASAPALQDEVKRLREALTHGGERAFWESVNRGAHAESEIHAFMAGWAAAQAALAAAALATGGQSR